MTDYGSTSTDTESCLAACIEGIDGSTTNDYCCTDAVGENDFYCSLWYIEAAGLDIRIEKYDEGYT